jgi:hypothetical protein
MRSRARENFLGSILTRLNLSGSNSLTVIRVFLVFCTSDDADDIPECECVATFVIAGGGDENDDVVDWDDGTEWFDVIDCVERSCCCNAAALVHKVGRCS